MKSRFQPFRFVKFNSISTFLFSIPLSIAAVSVRLLAMDASEKEIQIESSGRERKMDFSSQIDTNRPNVQANVKNAHNKIVF